MKSLLLCFVLSVSCLAETTGQSLFKVDTNKYRINLPDYWRRGNKIWQILNDKLPLVCEELKDKELCGDDCNPKYRVEFEMSGPEILGYYPNHISSNYTNTQYIKPSEDWEFVTYFSFECSLMLLDEKNKLLTRFILADTNEVWKVSNRATLLSFAPPPPPRLVRRRISASEFVVIDMNTIGTNQNTPTIGQAGETPYSYINNNKDKLAPTQKDMLAVVDRKISSW